MNILFKSSRPLCAAIIAAIFCGIGNQCVSAKGGTQPAPSTPPKTTTSTFKLTVGKDGKGTVTTSPAGTTFASGTVVTITATPAAGSPWMGWSGSIFGNFAVGASKTLTVVMNGNISLTAHFK